MQPHMVPGLKQTLASSWFKRTGELTWLEGIASTLLCNTRAKLVLFFLNVAITAGRPKCPANDNSCSSIFSDSCRSNLSSWSKSIWGEIFPTMRVLQSENLQACVNNLSQQSEQLYITWTVEDKIRSSEGGKAAWLRITNREITSVSWVSDWQWSEIIPARKNGIKSCIEVWGF